VISVVYKIKRKVTLLYISILGIIKSNFYINKIHFIIAQRLMKHRMSPRNLWLPFRYNDALSVFTIDSQHKIAF